LTGRDGFVAGVSIIEQTTGHITANFLFSCLNLNQEEVAEIRRKRFFVVPPIPPRRSVVDITGCKEY
jgi:hypothetical protein